MTANQRLVDLPEDVKVLVSGIVVEPDRVFTVLVCGGREFRNVVLMGDVLDALHRHRRVQFVVHGNQRGADLLSDVWAYARRVRKRGVPADWGRDGRAAGPIRNKAMLDLFHPHLVVAFPGDVGTNGMVNLAIADGVATIRVHPDGSVHVAR